MVFRICYFLNSEIENNFLCFCRIEIKIVIFAPLTEFFYSTPIVVFVLLYETKYDCVVRIFEQFDRVSIWNTVIGVENIQTGWNYASLRAVFQYLSLTRTRCVRWVRKSQIQSINDGFAFSARSFWIKQWSWSVLYADEKSMKRALA